jgi:hypothetical protein
VAQLAADGKFLHEVTVSRFAETGTLDTPFSSTKFGFGTRKPWR